MSPSTLLNYRYKILKSLAEGGFGKTFLAEDTQMPSRRRCVIKQLKPVSSRPEIATLVQERFVREAAVLDEVGKHHSQIPSLYAYFVLKGQFYLVQEWIDGEPLMVSEHRRWSEEKVRQLLVDLLGAIAHIHSKNIIHRDIKPDNIILRDRDQLPCLIDFGAVKELMSTVVNSAGLPKSSIVIGTPGYMPDDQAAGRPTFSSDLYSLGMTAICLLTGRSPASLSTDSLTGSLLWQQHAPNLNSTFAQLLTRSVHPNAQNRFLIAGDMLSALTSPVAKGTGPFMTAPPPVANTLGVQEGHAQTPTTPKSLLSTSLKSLSLNRIAVGVVAVTLGNAALWTLRPQLTLDSTDQPVRAPSAEQSPSNADDDQATTQTIQTDVEPDSAQGYLEQAQLLYRQNREAQALQSVEAALELDSSLTEALILKGDILADQSNQNLPGAVETYTQALTLQPDNASALDKRCKAYTAQKKWNLAEQDCSNSLSLDPNNAEIYSRRGDIRTEQQNYSGAIQDYTKAIDLNTASGNDAKNQPIYWARGQAYNGRGNANQSADDLQKALDDMARFRDQ